MAQESQIFLGKGAFPADGCGWPVFTVLRKPWLGKVLSLGTRSAESLPWYLGEKTEKDEKKTFLDEKSHSVWLQSRIFIACWTDAPPGAESTAESI